MRARTAAVFVAAVLAVAGTFMAAGPASASSWWHHGSKVCWGGPIHSGSYRSLTVKGICWIPDHQTVTVRGNLTVAPKATLNGVKIKNSAPDFSNFNMARIHVWGNVYVGWGAILGLGCSRAMGNDPMFPLCSKAHNSDVVIGGSLIAHSPRTMYLDGIVVRGSVVSTGGGPGVHVSQYDPAFNFPVKDITVHRDLVITGWKGGWVGTIRDQVWGSLVYLGNRGSDPDANEVLTNKVGHNLVCWGNAPKTQYGDAAMVPGAAPNQVRGHAIGQCKDLTKPFPTA